MGEKETLEGSSSGSCTAKKVRQKLGGFSAPLSSGAVSERRSPDRLFSKFLAEEGLPAAPAPPPHASSS